MKNFAKGRLSGAHSDSDTVFNLVSGEGSRFEIGDICVVYDGDNYDNAPDAYWGGAAELVKLTSAPTADTFPAVSRGYESTTALTLSGSITWVVETVITAGMWDMLDTSEIASAPDDGVLTESSGAITITGRAHRVDTSLADVTVDTINGATRDGQLLFLRPSSSSHNLTLEDGTGNIQVKGGSDEVISSTHDEYLLRYHSSSAIWITH